MAVDVVLPKLGPEMDGALLLEWLVADGDEVSVGQALATLETEKLTTDVEAEAAGTIQLLVEPETEISVGTVMARIGDGAAAPAPAAPTAAAVAAEQAPAPAMPEPAPVAVATSAPAAPALDPVSPPKGRLGRAGAPKASPLARRMAAEAGLDLAELARSMDGEPIRKRHVQEALFLQAQDGAGASPAEPAAGGERLSPMRRRIADHMLASVRGSAQTTDVREHDIGDLVEFRTEGSRWAKALGGGLGFMDLMIRATVLALREVPALNASLGEDDMLVQHSRINIGIAVAMPDGLIVPVLHDADQLELGEINRRVRDLVGRARTNALTLDELSGGTFTISNIGSYGSHFGTPILVRGQLGILATGAILDRPVVREGTVVPGKTMYTSLTVDHQVIDGEVMGRFQNAIATLLADPPSLVPAS